jgi:Zn-finger nucleic acid-binding protein
MNLNPHIIQLMRNVNEVAIDERIERSMFPDKDVVYIESRVKSVLAKKMAEHIVEQPKSLHHRSDVLSDSDIYSIRGIWVDREELYKILLAAYEIGRHISSDMAHNYYLSQMHEDRRRQMEEGQHMEQVRRKLEEENNRMQYQTINKHGKLWNI